MKRVLAAKYAYGLAEWKPVNIIHLTADLNAGVSEMRREVAKNALTLFAEPGFGDLSASSPRAGRNGIAYVGNGFDRPRTPSAGGCGMIMRRMSICSTITWIAPKQLLPSSCSATDTMPS